MSLGIERLGFLLGFEHIYIRLRGLDACVVHKAELQSTPVFLVQQHTPVLRNNPNTDNKWWCAAFNGPLVEICVLFILCSVRTHNNECLCEFFFLSFGVLIQLHYIHTPECRTEVMRTIESIVNGMPIPRTAEDGGMDLSTCKTWGTTVKTVQ